MRLDDASDFSFQNLNCAERTAALNISMRSFTYNYEMNILVHNLKTISDC